MGCAKSKQKDSSEQHTRPVRPTQSLDKLAEKLSLKNENDGLVLENTQNTPIQTPTKENKRELNLKENLERMREAREKFFKINYNEPKEAIRSPNALIMKTNFDRNLRQNLNEISLLETPESAERTTIDDQEANLLTSTYLQNNIQVNITPVTTRGIRTEYNSNWSFNAFEMDSIENKRMEKLLLRLLDCSMKHKLTTKEVEELQAYLNRLFESLIALLNEFKTTLDSKRRIYGMQMTLADHADLWIIEYKEIVECIKNMKLASEQINFNLLTKCAIKIENVNKRLKECLIELENQKKPALDELAREQLLNNHPKIKILINQLDDLNKQLPKTKFICECSKIHTPKTPHSPGIPSRPYFLGEDMSFSTPPFILEQHSNSSFFSSTFEQHELLFDSYNSTQLNTPISQFSEDFDKSLILVEKHVYESENVIINDLDDSSSSLPAEDIFLKTDEPENEENEKKFQSLGDFIKKNHSQSFESHDKPTESINDTLILEQSNFKQNKTESENEPEIETENEPLIEIENEPEHESIVPLSISSAFEINVKDCAELEVKLFETCEEKIETPECIHCELTEQSDMNNNELKIKEDRQHSKTNEEKKKPSIKKSTQQTNKSKKNFNKNKK